MRTLLALAALALLALGCARTKHDLLSKSEGASTKSELEAALGAPDDRTKLGPVETWTYEASDGTVSFLITGDKVQFQSTGPAREE